MPRRKPRPLYKRGDILKECWSFNPKYNSKWVVLDVATFDNMYTLDLADPEKRNQYSCLIKQFWIVNNPQNYVLVVSYSNLWSTLNGE